MGLRRALIGLVHRGPENSLYLSLEGSSIGLSLRGLLLGWLIQGLVLAYIWSLRGLALVSNNQIESKSMQILACCSRGELQAWNLSQSPYPWLG